MKLKYRIKWTALHFDFWIFPQSLEMEVLVLFLEMAMNIKWN